VKRAALPAVLLLAACATRSPAPPPYSGPPLARCYAIRYADAGAASVFPARLGLPGEGGGAWGEPPREGRRSWGMFGPGIREAAPGDSVRVAFRGAFSAIVLTFSEAGDSLSGSAYFADDVTGPTPPRRAPFTGSRAACPSAPASSSGRA
jgi:hypothetical protein